MNPSLSFDHLVITCADLDAGMAYIRDVFGVEIPKGGQHHFMGTHNAVMAVGEGIYLEVIAIDPSLPAPPGPRWFGLDTTQLKQRMKSAPVLAHYVLRSDDMAATLKGLDPELKAMLGPAMPASRGDLSWQITLNSDGIPPEGGTVPALIEWQGRPPQCGMAFPGPVLQKLVCFSRDEDRLCQCLEQLGAGNLMEEGVISVQPADVAGLAAEFAFNGRIIRIGSAIPPR